MSKAFLRESDQDTEPDFRAPVSPLPPGARNYITATGAARLREELRHLRFDKRQPLAALAGNDQEARAQLTVLDQRIRALQQSLFGADVVTCTPGATDVVRFGTTVTVRDSEESTAEYRLVGVDESDPGRGAVSWVSPIAQALMNSRVGSRVAVSTPSGLTQVTVIGIRYDQP